MQNSKMRIALFAVLFFAAFNANSQCGVTMSCGGTPGPLNPLNPPAACAGEACFRDQAARERHEEAYNCRFPPDALCAGRTINRDTQCCGRDPVSGNDAIQVKQSSAIDRNFDWQAYTRRCPNMRQSEGRPDALWAQCVVGQRHSPSDNWNIVEVLRNPSSPSARSYCIDGCSTPPAAINIAYNTNIFLVRDKDNPTGHQNSSFFNACRAHDICYQTCGASNTQAACDLNLRNDSRSACRTIPAEHTTTVTTFGITSSVNTQARCIAAADRMFDILSNLGLGESAFNLRKQQMCQCCA
jgi:hypothetical protein